MEPALQVFPRTWLTVAEEGLPVELANDALSDLPPKSIWVHLLARITPRYISPAVTPREEWRHYKADILTRAAVVSLALVLAAILVFVKTGCSVSVLHHTKAQVRARWNLHFSIAVLVLLLAVAASVVYWLLSGEGSSDAMLVVDAVLAGLAKNLEEVAAISSYVSTTSTRLDIAAQDGETVPGCPQGFITAVRQLIELETVCASHAAALDARFKDVSSFLTGAKDFLGGAFSKAAIAVYLSSISVGLVLIVLTVSLCRLRRALADASLAASSEGFEFPSLSRNWGPFIIAPLILVIGVTTGCEATLLMTTSSVCQAPEVSTISFSRQYRRVDTIVASYILGKGNNWIISDMNRIEETLEKVVSQLSDIDSSVRESCNAVYALADTEERTSDAQGATMRMQSTMTERKIQTSYTKVLRSDLCGQMMDGLVWSVLLQLLLGAGLLPVLAGLLHQEFLLAPDRPEGQSEQTEQSLELSQFT